MIKTQTQVVGSPAYHKKETPDPTQDSGTHLPAVADDGFRNQFETGQRVPPIGITDRGELCLIKISLATKPGTARS